ncbi:hypothetical protein [Pseudogemmobacter sonorensis]|uniref:hypothetical protein n=1 Tax=Pseudogemmobacter sonorensis TaxID=2989681 RepID=UPI0036BCCF99
MVIALSPERFAAGRSADPFVRAEIIFDAITGEGARLPLQQRFAVRAAATLGGITLSQTEVAQLDRFLDQGITAVR